MLRSHTCSSLCPAARACPLAPGPVGHNTNHCVDVGANPSLFPVLDGISPVLASKVLSNPPSSDKSRLLPISLLGNRWRCTPDAKGGLGGWIVALPPNTSRTEVAQGTCPAIAVQQHKPLQPGP